MRRPDDIALSFDVHDIWLGVRWYRSRQHHHVVGLQIRICLLPCLPIRLRWFKPWWLEVSKRIEADARLAGPPRGLE